MQAQETKLQTPAAVGMATTIFYCPGCGETDENKRCLGCRHR